MLAECFSIIAPHICRCLYCDNLFALSALRKHFGAHFTRLTKRFLPQNSLLHSGSAGPGDRNLDLESSLCLGYSRILKQYKIISMGKLCNIDANPKIRHNTREQYDDLCNPRIQLNPENFGKGYDSCNNWECMCKGHQPLSAFRSSSTPYQAPKATNVTAKMPVKTCMALIK